MDIIKGDGVDGRDQEEFVEDREAGRRGVYASPFCPYGDMSQATLFLFFTLPYFISAYATMP